MFPGQGEPRPFKELSTARKDGKEKTMGILEHGYWWGRKWEDLSNIKAQKALWVITWVRFYFPCHENTERTKGKKEQFTVAAR